MIWASEICFDQPVSGTSDTMMSMVSSASVSGAHVGALEHEPEDRHDDEQDAHARTMAFGIDGIRGAT